MNDIRRCPECGGPIPSGAPGGMCPKCLLAAGLESRGGPAGVAATQASPNPSGGFVPPEPEELAARFPQLEILELLGKGGMGAVYKARQRELDRLVAVKILPPEISRDPAFAERFTREARALARLSHPNIVGVYDFGQTKAPAVDALGSSETPLFYIVMEYVDGVNLRQAIQAGSIAPKEALAVVPQICAALQFAHDEGVVHRDIKPENILVDKRGRVKIADFGLAKIMESAGNESPANLAQLTATHQVMGTLRYMAPEQLEGTHTVDHRADIYSLGVVFYELLTGELPIGRFAAPSKKVQIDVRLDEVVLRALEKEPELRWQHASDVRTEVEAIVGDMPIAVRSIAASAFGREYKSERTWFGLPLVHIAFGVDPRTGKKRHAKGIVAIGDAATGVVAIGGAAYGGFCFGGFAAGVFAFGGLSLGLFALGGLAAGIVAWGGVGIGAIALGGLALGGYCYGGVGLGMSVLASNMQEPPAKRFFEPWAHNWSLWMTWLSIGLPMFYGLVFAWAHWLMRRDERRKASDGSQTPPAELTERRTFSMGWLPAVVFPGLLLLFVLREFGGPFLDSLRGMDGRVVELGDAWGIGSTTQSVQLSLVLITATLLGFMIAGLVWGLYHWSHCVAEGIKDPRAKASFLVRGPAIGLILTAVASGMLATVFMLWAFGESWFGPPDHVLRSDVPPPAGLPIWMSIGGMIGAAYWAGYFWSLWNGAVELLQLRSLRDADNLASRAMYPFLNFLVFMPVAFWLQAVLSRDDVRQAFPPEPERQEEPEQAVPASAGPRFSRTAIVGAVWAPLLFVALFATMFTWFQTTGVEGPSSPPPRPSIWLLIPIGVATLLGLAAPFATTILGCVAIGQIRRSDGMLYGLPLAVVDAMLFPLLLLDILIWLAIACVFAILGLTSDTRAVALFVSLPIMAVVDYVLARKAWRAAAGAPQNVAASHTSAVVENAAVASPSAASSLALGPTERRRLAGNVLLACSSLQIVSAILAAAFLLGAFGDPAEIDNLFDDTEARLILLTAQAGAFLSGMWALVGGLALKTTGEPQMARPANKSLLLPLTPSWLITGIPTLWTAGLLKD